MGILFLFGIISQILGIVFLTAAVNKTSIHFIHFSSKYCSFILQAHYDIVFDNASCVANQHLVSFDICRIRDAIIRNRNLSVLFIEGTILPNVSFQQVEV